MYKTWLTGQEGYNAAGGVMCASILLELVQQLTLQRHLKLTHRPD